MPDIAACNNIDCPSKDSCYRFTCRPSFRQCYGAFTVPKNQDRCDYFLANQYPLPFQEVKK